MHCALGGAAIQEAPQDVDVPESWWRVVAAVSMDFAMYLEALTPLAPFLFLPLATVANVGKNISWLAASATRAGIHLSFSTNGHNLADITAKAVCFSHPNAIVRASRD